MVCALPYWSKRPAVKTHRMRIGVWFNQYHLSYGGPSHVLIGTILGFLQLLPDSIILLNEPGDVNWIMETTDDYTHAVQKAYYSVIGPLVFTGGEGELTEYKSHHLWKTGASFVAPSMWYKHWICNGLPYNKPELAQYRKLHVWGAGVDTDYYTPAAQKTQDYFIYFKSQEYSDLADLHTFLFTKYFNLRGSVLVYYNYDKQHLRAAAQQSRFCIMLDKTETQGLASLEIMACDCPLFVIDWTVYNGNTLMIKGASSVPCMDDRCGMKVSKTMYKDAFGTFLTKLPTYTPRAYVLENYSYAAAARNLISLIPREHHQSKHNSEENDCLNKQANGGDASTIV